MIKCQYSESKTRNMGLDRSQVSKTGYGKHYTGVDKTHTHTHTTRRKQVRSTFIEKISRIYSLKEKMDIYKNDKIQT